MSEFEVIKFLLDEAILEQEKGVLYRQEERKAKFQAQKENKSFWACFNHTIKDTNKSLIKNNLKMIRRLTLSIEKEL
jgi:DNA-binding transcriptional regulator GbsR (MarR family)